MSGNISQSSENRLNWPTLDQPVHLILVKMVTGRFTFSHFFNN